MSVQTKQEIATEFYNKYICNAKPIPIADSSSLKPNGNYKKIWETYSTVKIENKTKTTY